jgi:hypothetical protein
MYHYQNSNSGYEEAYPDHPKYQPAAPETYGQSYDDPYYADEIGAYMRFPHPFFRLLRAASRTYLIFSIPTREGSTEI